MIHYKELGLVNTRELFKKAVSGKYAIPAYNFNNMEQLQAIIQACVETKSPVILQVSSGARKYANQTILRYMAEGAVQYAKELGYPIPIVLHLDHGDTFDLCKSCVETGFSSIMIDGSSHPYDENVKLTKQVVDFCHQYDVTVEGELGVLAGVEDEVQSEMHTYTQPADVEDFVKRTGVDSLAISIGTSHGAYKFKPGQKVEIRLDILAEIERVYSRIPDRAAWLLVGAPGPGSGDQQIRRQDEGCCGHPGRAASQGSGISGVQDQYRLRWQARDDSRDPESLRRETG